MGDTSTEEEIASHLIKWLDGEETLNTLRGLPERLRELSARHRSFAGVQRWDEIADLQSGNADIVESCTLKMTGRLRSQKLAWADYTRYIHEEAEAVQDCINQYLHEAERNCVPRRSKGKDSELNNLFISVDELHRHIGEIARTIRVVEKKTIDIFGSLYSRGDDPDVPNIEAKRVTCAWESRATDVGDPCAENLETLLGGWCADLRNGLLLGNAILDQQQETIGKLRCQTGAAPMAGPDESSCDKWIYALMGSFMTIVFTFLVFLAVQVVG